MPRVLIFIVFKKKELGTLNDYVYLKIAGNR